MLGMRRRGVNEREWGRSLWLSPRESMLVKKGSSQSSRNLLVCNAEIYVFGWLQGIPFERFLLILTVAAPPSAPTRQTVGRNVGGRVRSQSLNFASKNPDPD